MKEDKERIAWLSALFFVSGDGSDKQYKRKKQTALAYRLLFLGN